MAEISVRRLNWRQWSGFAPTWERIHSMCPDASFFLSREWVDCWLATFAGQLSPDLLAFVKDGEVVSCCFLVRRTQWVRGIPLRRVYLNCAGEDEADSTCLEFNMLLSLPAYAKHAAEALTRFLRNHYWDELVLPGTVDEAAVRALSGSFRKNEIKELPSRYIDFSHLRDRRIDFLYSVSAKTRYHIRRTQRAYEEIGGACTLQVAQTVDEALEMLRQLADLHQARWEGRGKAGAFGSAKFCCFHERLIRQAFDRVLLFRLQAGKETVGLLHCFVHRGWVYFYQSGFSYTLDGRRSPGLLTLYYAVAYCMERSELMGFDFMAGDLEYKRSLTAPSDYQTLRWMVIRRSTVQSLLFLSLRRLKRKYVEFRQQSRYGHQPPGGIGPSADVLVPNVDTEQVDSDNGKQHGF